MRKTEPPAAPAYVILPFQVCEELSHWPHRDESQQQNGNIRAPKNSKRVVGHLKTKPSHESRVMSIGVDYYISSPACHTHSKGILLQGRTFMELAFVNISARQICVCRSVPTGAPNSSSAESLMGFTLPRHLWQPGSLVLSSPVRCHVSGKEGATLSRGGTSGLSRQPGKSVESRIPPPWPRFRFGATALWSQDAFAAFKIQKQCLPYSHILPHHKGNPRDGIPGEGGPVKLHISRRHGLIHKPD